MFSNLIFGNQSFLVLIVFAFSQYRFTTIIEGFPCCNELHRYTLLLFVFSQSLKELNPVNPFSLKGTPYCHKEEVMKYVSGIEPLMRPARYIFAILTVA